MTATTESPATATAVADAIDRLVVNAKQALDAYSAFTQDDVNLLVKKASVAALGEHGALAVMAVEETGRGVFEDKAVKNIFACEHVTHSMGPMKTVGNSIVAAIFDLALLLTVSLAGRKLRFVASGHWRGPH